MRARFRHAAGDYAGAEDDWRLLRANWAWQHDEAPIAATWPVSVHRVMPLMHPYEGALAGLLSPVPEDHLHGPTARAGPAARLPPARHLVQQVKQAYPAAVKPRGGNRMGKNDEM